MDLDAIQHGVFTVVVGDREAKDYLRRGSTRVDEWLYELVDAITFHAADRLREHAPGRIKRLVEVDLPDSPQPKYVRGVAGVTSDPLKEESVGGSDEGDFPFYVDQGSGLFGEHHRIIFGGGTLMGPFQHDGRKTFTRFFRGQEAQHFSDRAFADTIAYTPGRIQLAKSELVPRT